MCYARTARIAIVALLAATASLGARAGDTGAGPGKTDALATIQRELVNIDLKLAVHEQAQVDIKLKLSELTQKFAGGGNLPALLADTLQLLETNDAVSVEIANLAARLAKIIDTLVRMQNTPSNSDARLTVIKQTLTKARALATRAGNDSAQADNLHTAIKLLALEIEEKIG